MDAEPVHGGTVKKRKTPGKPGVMPNRVRLSGDFSPGQLATVATESLPHYEAEAKKRQKGGQGGVLLVAGLPQASEHSKARDQAAAAVGF
jgi:hypothetical protein